MDEFTIEGSGASGTLISDFNTVAETRGSSGQPKYSASPILAWLAKVVVGIGGGANKDTPLYELCHLIFALNTLNDGHSRSDRRMVFFLGAEQAIASVYKNYFMSTQQNSSNILNTISLNETNIEVHYQDEYFVISYQRMAFLSSLFEFLSSMNNFSYFETFNELFDALDPSKNETASSGMRLVQDTSNRISSILRTYRKDNLPRAQSDAKFDKLFKFLQQRSIKNHITIEDNSVMEFWQQNSFIEEYRIYKTVFDNFIVLMKSLDEQFLQKSASQASRVGVDFENQEVEPDDSVSQITDFAEWQSPFNILDEVPVSTIKFFKQKSERQPIEQLMFYGPYAHKLPLAFMRSEAFGVVQNGISNDLRSSKGPEKIAERIMCNTAKTYSNIYAEYQVILSHVKQLQLATFHVLYSNQADKNKGSTDQLENNVIKLFDEPLISKFEEERNRQTAENLDKETLLHTIEASSRAFKSLTRSGFTEEFLDKTSNIRAFRVAAGALVQIVTILEKFLNTSVMLQFSQPNNPDIFNKDKKLFSKQFDVIYGETE